MLTGERVRGNGVIIQILKLRLLAFIFLLLAATQAMASVIASIEFIGNKNTQAFVLLQEMRSQVGDELDIATVKEDVQAIMDLHLFRDVKYSVYDSISKNNVRLVIRVTEKHYLFVLPEIRVDEVDKALHYGVRAYWDNIAGTNQSLRLKLREYGETLGVQDIRQSLEYTMPRIDGSPYTLNFFTEYRESVIEYSAADPQFRQEKKIGFNVDRWRHLDNRSSGWYLGTGLYREERNNSALYDGDVSLADLQGNFLQLRFGYQKINEYLFNRRGKDFGYILNTNRILFNEEDRFTKHLIFYRSYYRLKSHPMNNLNVQMQLGASDGDYLGDNVFSLGGSELRGYSERGLYNGNAMVLMNIEYLVPFSNNPAYRYGVLLDVGNAYDRAKDIDFKGLHTTIGLAFRWKVAAFVKVNIRLDIGYATDTGDSNIILNSRHLF